MKSPLCFICLSALIAFFAAELHALPGGAEFKGRFDSTLAASEDSMETNAFKFVSPERLKGYKTFAASAHVSSTKLYNPATDSKAVAAMLVEEVHAKPVLFVDLNGDKTFSDDEKFTFDREFEDDSSLWKLTVNIPVQNSPFAVCPIFLRYFKGYKTEDMSDDDRLVKQSTSAFARGRVDVNGKTLLVQYDYSFSSKQVDPMKGWLGVDTDGNGEIDMDSVSPEAMKVDGQTAIFRVGDHYYSTKKANVQKNQITMRENEAKEYKRIELTMGSQLTDFEFVDLAGKTRKLSEFRGKYVIVDVWGFWCPACRSELPYLKEAYRLYRSRNLEIVGLNTDEFPPEEVKRNVDKVGMTWTQARFESVVDLLGKKMMVTSFPTTLLLSPEGKILSRSRSEKDEPDLRGRNLLTTLDGILPKTGGN
jgi:thiol-disulfide isomerase/thioredoxin